MILMLILATMTMTRTTVLLIMTMILLTIPSRPPLLPLLSCFYSYCWCFVYFLRYVFYVLLKGNANRIQNPYD